MSIDLSVAGDIAGTVLAMSKARPRKKRLIGKPNSVAKRRRLLGMTQTDLAVAAGLDQGTISLFENQNVWPSYENLVAIADALRCSTFEQLWSDPDAEDLNALAAPLGPADRHALVEMVRAFVASRKSRL